MSGTLSPYVRFLSNEDPDNFAKLAREFLDAAKFTHIGFRGVPRWPTYYLVLQSTENFLKAFLLVKGATVEDVRKIGHRICYVLEKAEANGFAVPVQKELEEAVLATSSYYTVHDFRYRRVGEWTVVLPNDAIHYAEEVGKIVEEEVKRA